MVLLVRIRGVRRGRETETEIANSTVQDKTVGAWRIFFPSFLLSFLGLNTESSPILFDFRCDKVTLYERASSFLISTYVCRSWGFIHASNVLRFSRLEILHYRRRKCVWQEPIDFKVIS